MRSGANIQKEDLDAFFPTPQKLLLAEKRILLAELYNLKVAKEPNLPPRDLFPPVQDQRQPFSSVATQSISDETELRKGAPPSLVTSSANLPSATAKPASSYLEKRQVQLTQDVQLLQAQLEGAKHHLALRKTGIDDCGTIADKLSKICSVCHLPGHTKLKCENRSCEGIHSCKLPAKHPEVSKELLELKTLIKDLENKEAKARN